MASVQWMLDDISWDIYMSKNDKYISIINNHWDNTTTSYNYNLTYKHWNTWTYDVWVRSLGTKPYWDYIFQYTPWVVNQEISFSLGGSELYHMKTCFFVKMTLVAETNEVPDYLLTIDKYIWWLKLRKTVDLKDYPINNKILSQNNLLWYEQFWEADLSSEPLPNDLWYIINVQVRINETADLFVFTLSNKENSITYWWGVIWYRNLLPEVTAYNYITKQSTR
jgi:hypothetical protein